MNLNVNRGRQTEVHRRRHHPPGIERKLDAGEAVVQFLAQALDVFKGPRKTLLALELDQNECIHRTAVGRVRGWPVHQDTDVGN